MMYEYNMDNMKRILCYNIISCGSCNYGNKCLYAHSLNDQIVDPIRKKVYAMITGTEALDSVDLINNQKLYDTMILLCKLCALCNRGICPGGYNCRSGAISMQYKICYDDLIKGACQRVNCLSVHLTKKGFVPYLKQRSKLKKVVNVKLIDKFNFDRTKKINEQLDRVKSILLTDKFLMMKPSYTDSSESETDEKISEIIEYLNTDNNSSDESIFLL